MVWRAEDHSPPADVQVDDLMRGQALGVVLPAGPSVALPPPGNTALIRALLNPAPAAGPARREGTPRPAANVDFALPDRQRWTGSGIVLPLVREIERKGTVETR